MIETVSHCILCPMGEVEMISKSHFTCICRHPISKQIKPEDTETVFAVCPLKSGPLVIQISERNDG